jgi:signal transduction histidine kinase
MNIPSDKIYKAKILIVDDNASNVTLLEQSLQLAGYSSIFFTTDSRIACDLYKEIQPNLVLLDINMPHLNGYQVMKQLKEVDKDYYAPIMVLTAQSDHQTRLKAIQEGARDFLTKPFDQVEIQIRIKSMLEVRLLNDLVRKQNRMLEEKVQERTLDLANSNVNLTHEMAKREKAENNLRQYANDLELKNQELKDFVYIASHDLQEPLRRIITFSDLISSKSCDLDEKSLDYLNRMQKSSERMKRLIEDLLNFCKITQGGKPSQETNLEDLVKDVLLDLEILIKESEAKVNVINLPTLEIDASQVQQLFQNLIGNAIKYRRDSEAPRVTIRSRFLEDERWEITVEDNGIGFNDEYKDRIFRPFERLHRKEEFEGSGMGLAICRNIVLRHGGTIKAESQSGIGTKIIFTLPAQPVAMQSRESI